MRNLTTICGVKNVNLVGKNLNRSIVASLCYCDHLCTFAGFFIIFLGFCFFSFNYICFVI